MASVANASRAESQSEDLTLHTTFFAPEDVTQHAEPFFSGNVTAFSRNTTLVWHAFETLSEASKVQRHLVKWFTAYQSHEARNRSNNVV